MLNNLHIQNYALIESLDIDFQSGFSVITGETGAGKSIILGALSILLGNRADSTAIAPAARRCIVEATFSQLSDKAAAFFQNHDLDFYDNECTIRRELTDSGKSRAFINDTPVSLSQVKELSTLLVDVHSQHQTLLLNNADFQLDVLDSVAGDDKILDAYHADYRQYIAVSHKLQQLEQQAEQSREALDFIQFQHNELQSANLVDGEQEELEEELLILENAESIKQAIFDAQHLLADITEKTHTASRTIDKIANVFQPAVQLAERLDSCAIELDDIDSTLAANDTTFDPQRLEEVNQRLDTIYSLQKKYHKATVGELLQLQAELSDKLNSIINHDDIVLEKRRLCKELHDKALSTAVKLTAIRKQAAAKIEQELIARLKPMGLPNISFVVQFTSLDELAPFGQEKVCFLFSSNKSTSPRSLEKIASGGEIARVMLSLKAMLAAHRQLPTIIFDEIDTGVSGRIADEMGSAMEGICNSTDSSNTTQVICITHNPQIAARGHQHYRVFKEDTVLGAHTYIEQLDSNQRIHEIAKMLSGSDVSEAAISNAKTLLKYDTQD